MLQTFLNWINFHKIKFFKFKNFRIDLFLRLEGVSAEKKLKMQVANTIYINLYLFYLITFYTFFTMYAIERT